MEYKDYYKVLEVDKNASEADIKSSYRKLAKKYHPDVNGGDEKAQEKFKEISEAYEVLGNKEKRKKYDQFGNSYNFEGGQNFNPNDFGYTYTSTNMGDFSDFFEMFFGGSDVTRTNANTTGGFNFKDIFGGSTQKKRQKARSQYSTALNIELSEAYKGAEKHVSLSMNGQPLNITVKVPKGITTGKKLKVKGEKWGVDGDIVFNITVNPNPTDRLEGNDIITKAKIYPWDAYMGGSTTVAPVSGKLKIGIPKNAKTGQRLKVKGRGFEDLKGNTGDLYVEFEIVNPDNLTDEQKNLYEKLKETTK